MYLQRLTVMFLLFTATASMKTTSTSQVKTAATSSDYRHLVTSILINAPAKTVWGILMDFEAYPTWNPFVTKINGEAKVGNSLSVKLQPHGQKPSEFNTKVIVLEDNKHFAWKGKLLFGGLFDGTHHFELEQISPTQTRLIQHEYFDGLLVPMLKKMLTEDTKISFEALNEALKNRAEISGQKTAKLN